MTKLKIDIPSFSDEGAHTRYKVVALREGSTEAVTHHRFSEFQKLHTALALATTFPVSKTYGFGQASDTTKRERRHKLQEYIRSTVAAFPPDGLPQPLLTFLGLKSYPVQRRTPSTASPANGSANSSSSTLGGSGGVAGAAGTSVPVTFTPTFTPRTDSDGYVLCGGGMAKFDAALPTEPDEAMREAIKLGDAMLCTQLLAAKADPDHADRQDRQGNLPLHLACIFNRCDMALALIEAGADPKKPNGAGELPSKLAPVSLRMKVPELVPAS